jgi:hypothetical protein
MQTIQEGVFIFQPQTKIMKHKTFNNLEEGIYAFPYIMLIACIHHHLRRR